MTKEGRHNWGNSGSNWRCTFNTEWDIVQNLKGTVSNVSFENGQAMFVTASSSKITFKGTWVTRTIKFELEDVTSFRCKLATGRTIVVTGGTVSNTGFSSATYYVNGAATSTVPATGKVTLIVENNADFTVNDLQIGYDGTAYGTFKADLAEQFNYLLSASEATNDYNKATHQALTDVSEQLGSELVTNGGFDTDTGWTKGAGWTIGSGVASHAAGSKTEIYQSAGITASKTYKVIYTSSNLSGGGGTRFILGNDSSGAGISRGAAGTFTETITLDAAIADDRIYIQADSSLNCSIDNVSVKEVLHPSITTLSNYTSRRGFSEDLYTTLNTTNLPDIVRRGSVYAAKFVAANSDLITIGNKGTVNHVSFVFWNDGTAQNIMTLDNGTTNITSNGTTLTHWGTTCWINGAATTTLTRGWNIISVISTADKTGSNIKWGYTGSYGSPIISDGWITTGNINLAEHTQFWTLKREKLS
jgi:hypothetical protein